MILWINGTFGVGKTTASARLADSLHNFRQFDPESVGYMLANSLDDVPVNDFQEYPAWRRLVPVVADEIVSATAQHLVAAQSVLDEDYWLELREGLVGLGHEVFHVVLDADSDSLHARIDAGPTTFGHGGTGTSTSTSPVVVGLQAQPTSSSTPFLWMHPRLRPLSMPLSKKSGDLARIVVPRLVQPRIALSFLEVDCIRCRKRRASMPGRGSVIDTLCLPGCAHRLLPGLLGIKVSSQFHCVMENTTDDQDIAVASAN